MATPASDRSGSIRRRAAALTSGLLAISLIAVIAYTFVAARTSLIRTGEARAVSAANQVASMVAGPLPARIADVQRLVDHDAVRALLTSPSPENETAVAGRLKPIVANAALHQTLELWTTDGRRVLLLQVPPSGGSVPPSTAAPASSGVLPYRRDNDILISEVVVDVPAGGPGMPVLGRLLSRRAATSTTTPDALSRLIGGGGRVLVGNQDGSIWTNLARIVDGPALDARTAGVHHFAGPDGATMIAAVAPMAGTPLSVVVEFPMSFVVEPAWALLRQLTLVGFVFTLFAVAIVWWRTGRITQPLNELTDALRGVSGGEFNKRVAANDHTEVGRLGEAFNSMAAQIQSGLAEIEARARQLQEKDQRKSAMMNAALDSIITTDADGLITDCNPVAERMFGHEPGAMRAQNLWQLLALQGPEPVLGRRVEVRANRAGGTKFPAEVSVIAIRDGFPGFAAFVRDLTEQKAGEESLRRSITLESENRRVQEASRLKSEFLANMSHELRTPLNAIIGFAELLYDGQVTPDMPQFKEFMHDILTSGQHLLQLINDVLDLSKVEAGRLEFHPEDTDVGQVVTESLGILRTLAAQKQLTIAHDVEPTTAKVFVDRARLKQVLYNYLSNAIKFTPEGGRINVRVSAEGDADFRIEVTDSGIGISAEDQQRLFVEFNQLEAGAAKKHQGTGLGLALTKRLVEAQGGKVGVRSSVGQGSTFYVVLPRRATRGTPLAGPRSITSQQLGAPSVLVIEDTAADQELIVRTLVAAGFNVETATTRAQALVKLASQSFDAITLDLLLPDATGADILNDLRASERNRDVPVVVITVIARDGAVAGFAVSDILAKPVDGSVLLSALDRAGVRAGAKGNVLVVDDDPGSLRLMAASLAQLGFTSVCVERAMEGLRLCELQPPLAVVLDLQMPEMDGFGFLEHFRMLPSCRHTPVIVWTVKDLTQDDYDRLRSSVQGVMGKGHSSTASVVEELRRFTTQRQA